MIREKYHKVGKHQPRTEAKPTKPAFGYYGAKQKISASIIELFPPHNAWVEVFCGSAAITLAKKPAQIEVINDLDRNVVNLFNQLRNNKRRLISAVKNTPYARDEFELAKRPSSTDTELERARKFLVVSMMAVNATVGASRCGFSYSTSYTRNGVEARVSRWNAIETRIENAAKRLKSVRVENQDARAIVRLFLDRPATLMYLDPPYFVDRSHDYPVDEKDKSFHEELLDLCCRSKAMLIVSSYDNRLYRKYLNRKTGWKTKIIRTTTRDTDGKDFERKEVLWMNAHFMKARATNKVLVRLSKKEQRDYKVNPSR